MSIAQKPDGMRNMAGNMACFASGDVAILIESYLCADGLVMDL